MDVEDLKRRLAQLVFRLEWLELNGACYGTGFFVSAGGLALTAYHNLPQATREDPAKPITAKWCGKQVPMYWKLPDEADAEWQRAQDIAVLEARPEAGTVFPACHVTYLDGSWSRQERATHWRGRTVALMGYPRDYPKDARLIVGSISLDEPIVDPRTMDDEGHPTGYADQSLALGVDFQLSCEGMIKGVSGAPVMDRDTGEIIGVEFAAWPEHERVFATEFHHVAKAWPRFAEFATPVPRKAPAARRSITLSLAGVSLLAMALWAILWLGRPWSQLTPGQALLDARPGGAAASASAYLSVEPAPPAAAGQATVGVTLWRLRPSAPSDAVSIRLPVHEQATGSITEWTPERVPAGYRFADGDYVRIGIESPRSGYLYVIDREQRGGETLTSPTLIFPTLRIRAGDNRVFAGRLTEIPAESDTPPYLTLRLGGPSQTGELLSIVVAPRPIEGLTIQRGYQEVTPAKFEVWRRWQVTATRLELKGGAGRPWTPVERAAGHEGERALRQDEPAPQTLYRVPVEDGRPFLIEIPLAIRK